MSAQKHHDDYWSFDDPRPAPKPYRSSRTTPEKHEGRNQPSTYRLLPEEVEYEAKKAMFEAMRNSAYLDPENSPSHRTSPRPTPLDPAERRKVRHKHGSYRHESRTEPGHSGYDGDVDRQTLKKDSRTKGPEPFSSAVPARSDNGMSSTPGFQNKLKTASTEALYGSYRKPDNPAGSKNGLTPGRSDKLKTASTEALYGSSRKPNNLARSKNGLSSTPDLQNKPNTASTEALRRSRQKLSNPKFDSAGSRRRISKDHQNSNTTYGSDVVREGPRSSKRNAVPLRSRIPMPPEAPIDREEDSSVISESSLYVHTPVDTPEQEGMHREYRPNNDTNDTTRTMDARTVRKAKENVHKTLPVLADHERKQQKVKSRSSVRKHVRPREPGIRPSAFGWTEEHLILGPTDEDVLVATNPLGHGSLGVVEEVRRIDGRFPTLVRKRVVLPLPKRQAAAYLKIVQGESRILRSLIHPHIVTLIGSYEDMKQPRRPSYCLLMSPVGENDLEAFLTIVGEHNVASEFSIRWRDCIRRWMACLASALKYMHASGIRHQDIKPSNIIHKGNHVFFTDFSSSSSFKIGHTTSTENPTRSTPMYGAPEVTSDRGKHGRTTDIFSLGCVFSDMLSVVEGRTVLSFQDYLRNDGQPAATDAIPLPRALSYSEKIPVINNWFADSHIFKRHVSKMLQTDRKVRPTATEVLQAFMLNEVCDVSCSCLRAEIL